MAENLNTTAPVAKTTRARRKTTAAVIAPVAVEQSEALILQHVDELDALLGELGVPQTVIEGAQKMARVEEVADEVLEAAPGGFAEIGVDAATPEGVLPGAMPSSGEIATDADIEAATHASAAAVEPDTKSKRVPTPRKHYADKVERLVDRMGEKLADYSVLTTEDAGALEGSDGLKAVTERTLEIIRGMNSKEKNRATNFMEWLSGRRSTLNAVLFRTLQVLSRDGHIQTGTGDEGNVIKDLLGAEYSLGSARAMAGNTIGMFADLKVIIPLEGHKGRFVGNADSLLLAAARAKLEAAPTVPPAKGEKVGGEPVKADEEATPEPKPVKAVKAKKGKKVETKPAVEPEMPVGEEALV